MSILTWYEVNPEHITLKFDSSILASTLSIDKFVLSKEISAAWVPVTSAFKPMEVSRDYYSISRTLVLYLSNPLDSNSVYKLDISGLKDVSGSVLPSDFFTWLTETVTVDDVEPPSRDIVDVEDYSIKSISDFLILPDVDANSITSLSVIDRYPDSDISYNLSPSFVEGRIQLTFNVELAANYISGSYFKVQRRWLDSPSSPVWENLTIYVTADKKDVYIYLPSDDATPVYGEPGHNYWLEGYKYRVRVSAGIGAA